MTSPLGNQSSRGDYARWRASDARVTIVGVDCKGALGGYATLTALAKIGVRCAVAGATGIELRMRIQPMNLTMAIACAAAATACSGGAATTTPPPPPPLPETANYATMLAQSHPIPSLILVTGRSNLFAVVGTAHRDGGLTPIHDALDCVYVPPANGPDATETPQSGGTITVTGGAEPVSIMAADNNQYEDFASDDLIWPGGAVLTFALQGGTDVQPAQATVTMPLQTTLTAPARAGLTHARNADLQLTWSPTAGILTVDASSIGMSSVACRFDATLGKGTVPAALLSNLGAGKGKLFVEQIAETRATVGGRVVTATALTDALAPDGTPFDLVDITWQ
jgi:hypothetical protein